MSSGQKVSLQTVAGNVAQTGFVSLDQSGYDDIGRYVTDTHQKELYQRNVDA